MALRTVAVRLAAKRSPLAAAFRSRAFSSDGKVLGEEERAAENMFIKKMEKEKLEKAARQQAQHQEPSGKNSSSEPGSTPVIEASTDSSKNIAVFAGVVAIVAAGWWFFGSSTKAKELEQK